MPNPAEPVDLVTFTAKILNGKLYFLCSDMQLPGPMDHSHVA